MTSTNPASPPTPAAPTALPGQRAGYPFPQGASLDHRGGVNFSLFAEGAEGVELCLFDDVKATAESARVRLREHTNGVWHVHLPQLRPGQLYGYRVHGPYAPEKGLRFNPHKLLLDPYAKAIGREVQWHDALYGYTIGHADADLSFDERDSAPYAPLAVVADHTFDWGDDRRPMHLWHDTVIYEAHVRGLSMRHPDVPEHLRGTYAGLASPPIIAHLKKLGITAIELMPVHHFLDDRHLVEKGLSNYWGYNTLGFFAPEPAYASQRDNPSAVVREFKEMVKALHAAGIEVILDVVYNHTAEGNHLGPTLAFRGIDNLAYYRTVGDQPRYYMDYTGCGNTLNMTHPHSLQLLMDSLRYWVTEMRVDGFRFDLASALARELHEVDQLGAFFDTIYQDPTLATVKLIAEPWDLGEGGYQVGNFPIGWAEWNGRYRDTLRRYWKGDMGEHADIAWRIGGSADLYERTRRAPSASINFVTAHDGFTLHDLVSYDGKHNEANGEDNRDGADDNAAWNSGAEGPTDDPAILELRERRKRNFLATLLLSQGVPMICAGDEFGRTQQGNNNGYCQDNELSWHDWDLDAPRAALLEFTARLVQYRRQHPNLHRQSFRERNPGIAWAEESIQWIRSDGEKMTKEDWEEHGWMRTLGVFLRGDAPELRDAEGEPTTDDDFVLLLNAHHEPAAFTLLAALRSDPWEIVIDTARPDLVPEQEKVTCDPGLRLEGRSLILLRRPRAGA